MIHTGDCREVMATLDAESIDAIVTDPPYGLEFMGKAWDKLGAGIEPTTDTVWTDRAPGSTLSFGGGGQRVRYGKSAKTAQGWHEQWAREALRVAKPGAYLLAFGGTRTVHRMTCAIEDAGWIIRDMLVWGYASGFPKGRANLKPAWEPIVMARKPGPLRPLAIDECRIPSGGERAGWHDTTGTGPRFTGVTYNNGKPGDFDNVPVEPAPAGRWPANVILTSPIFDGGWDGVVGGGETASGNREGAYAAGGFLNGSGPVTATLVGDSGTYSRFFLIPKASRSDREPVLTPEGHDRAKRFTTHPTVKPVDLMRHLVRLVTPTGGIVLDPFLGSGTTAIAAEMEGFDWIGIEKEPEYVAIAEARLNGTQRGMALA